MFKKGLLICSLILAVFGSSVTGCSSKNEENNKDASASSRLESVILGETYVIPAKEQTFYCMRVKDRYYKFVLTGSSAELLSSDDPSLFPILEDGQFARVTAVIEETYSDFGYVPNITLVSTRIVKLTASEPIEFEDITKSLFNLPSADDNEIKKISKLFQYMHNGKLYLILRYQGRVTAYTKNGLFIDYEITDGEEPFERFFNALRKS